MIFWPRVGARDKVLLSASIRDYGHVTLPAGATKSAPSALSPEGINSLPNL